MSTQLEKINAFVDSIANNQLNEKQQSLLFSSNSEEEIGGTSTNGKHCENKHCSTSSNAGNCKNTSNCKDSTNKGRCTNKRNAGCLVTTNQPRPAVPSPGIVIRS